MRGARARSILAVLALTAGCKDKPAPPPTAPAPAASSASLPSAGTPCGPLSCAQFDTPALAFAAAIPENARVVSVGEAHAQKGATGPSAARRFTDEVLPSLAPRLSDLVVELMTPPSGCKKEVAVVREAQAPVTQSQAPTDQGDYVAMGEAARKLGVVPDLLRPTCADLAAIEDAGDDAIDASLRTIARLTQRLVKKTMDRHPVRPGDPRSILLTYGGAVHVELDPTPERRAWTFGPELDVYTEGRYVAITFYAPESISDSDAWQRLPWYAHYDREKLGGRATMYRLRERSYAIILPAAR